MTGRTIRIGAGAGFSADRIEPALDLLDRGALDYLAFECLAERTIGLAQAERQANPAQGYDPLLKARMTAALPIAARNGVRIISNMGAANPVAAAQETARIARDLGLSGYRTAAVTGDDVLDLVMSGDYPLLDREGVSRDLGGSVVSANAYLGVEGIVSALAGQASVVLTGRVCDPALFLAPLVHEFHWAPDDWTLLGQGTLVGHMLECAGQLTGGYFANPGFDDVPDLANLGFPFADVSADGAAVFGKLDGTGGCLTTATCKQQLLYEILDPGAYLQSDVVADFRAARIEEQGRDRVRLTGGAGRVRPETLKVSICYEDGYAGEGQISYGGPGAEARGQLALAVVRERLAQSGIAFSNLRLELIGVNAIDRRSARPEREPGEVRVRVAAQAGSQRDAERIGAEVEALYTNGPMGGGGVSRATRKVVAVASTLIDRRLVVPRIHWEVA